MSAPDEEQVAAPAAVLAATAASGRAETGAGADSGAPGKARLAWFSRPQVLARLVWLAGLVAAAIVLFVCYLLTSRTYPITSDGASNALQAWDMLHGNLLLRGWTMTDVSFYTTELPEYMVVEAIRGLNADVMHVCGAITYTLVVLTGGMLARGTATGREGLIRLLIAAGIMVAPEIGSGVFILVLQPDHIGTQVPLLLIWLLLDRAPRRWYVPVAIGALLTWVTVADRLAVLIGAVPLAVVAAIHIYQALVQRRERPAAVAFEGALILAAGISAVLSSLIVRLIGAHGGYTVLPLASGLTKLNALPSHLWLALESVLGLYGADFLGMSMGLKEALTLLHFAGLGLAIWALLIVVRRFWTWPDLIAQILAAAIVINLAAYLFSTTPTSYWSAREIAGVLPAGAVLAGRVLAPRLRSARLRSARLMPAGAAVLACYLVALGYVASYPSEPAATQPLASWLGAHHLDYGLSSYGVANETTMASGGTVSVRPVTFTRHRASGGPDEFDRTWYDPARHDASFVVLTAPPGALDGITGSQVYGVFGRPSHLYRYRQYVIMTYDTNLLTSLSPLPHPRIAQG